MKNHYGSFHWLLALVALLIFPSLSDASERRYLAVDPALHAELENLKMVMGQAQHEQLLWRQYDAAWEEANGLELGALGRVFRDHEGRWRMYYEFMHANAERVTAVAFSDDGLHWTKPALNLAPEIADHPDSNIISLSGAEDAPGRGLLDGKWYRGAHAFYDAQAKDPDERYKLVWRQGHDIYVATAPDGLRFQTQGRAVDYYADTSPSHFYDPMRERYVIYGRIWFDKADREPIQNRLGADGKPPVRRGVVLHQSPRWSETPWPAELVGQVLIDPMDVFGDGGWTDIYTPNIQLYHGQYVGFPAVFFRTPLPDRTGTAGPIYPIFMHSADGVEWTFPDLKHPMIDLTPHLIDMGDTQEVGMIFPSSTFVETPEALRVYYSSRGFQHYAESPGDRNDVSYHLATMRPDGFASLQAESGAPGVWKTPPVRLPQDVRTLRVNADVEGSLQAILLDPETNDALPGFSAEADGRFQGDDVAAAIGWRDAAIAQVAGQEVVVQFVIDDGGVYSFWFE